MQEVIDERKLEPKSEWKEASNIWRLPYWDWGQKQRYPDDHHKQPSRNDFGLPYLFTVPQVPIYLPGTDRETSYDNPLIRFVNPEIDPVTKLPLPMGKMPQGKQRWNINDDVPFDPTKHATLPVSETP